MFLSVAVTSLAGGAMVVVLPGRGMPFPLLGRSVVVLLPGCGGVMAGLWLLSKNGSCKEVFGIQTLARASAEDSYSRSSNHLSHAFSL